MSEEVDFEVLLGEHRRDLNAVCEKMASLKEVISESAAVFAAKWYRETAREFIEHQPNRSIRLGSEKLKEMKSEVFALAKVARGVVDEILRDPQLWWHEQVKSGEMTALAIHSPFTMETAIRLVLGRLGLILEKFGYAKTRKTDNKDRDVWCEYEASDYTKVEGEHRPFCPFTVSWPEDLQIKYSGYRELQEIGQGILESLKTTEVEQKKAEALKLWDNA